MAKGKGTRSGRTGTRSSGASARLRKPYRQTPLGEAFPAAAGGGIGAAVAAAATGPVGMGAASTMAGEALDVTRAAISATGLSTGGVPALVNLLKLMDFATVEEALGSLRILRQPFAEQFKLPHRVVESLIKALEAKAQPLPSDDSGPLSFGLAAEPAPGAPRTTDFLLPLPNLQSVPVADGGDGSDDGGIGAAATMIGGIGAAPRGASAALGASGLPASVNLISQLPNPVRNQAMRNTCVAFSTLVAYEHYLSVSQGTNFDLSEQFVYWASKQRDGLPVGPDNGTFIWAAKKSFEEVGVCPEDSWAYNPNPVPDDPTQAPPPSGALSAANQFIPAKVLKVRPNSVDDFKFLLSTGRCIAFGVPIWAAFWQNQAALRTGRIKYWDNVPPTANMGHAMCIVGYQDDTSNPLLGGGRFIIRNSHGTEVFGTDPTNPYGPGHGTIAYSYIVKFGAAFNDIALAFE